MDPKKFKNKKYKIGATNQVELIELQYKDEKYEIQLLPYRVTPQNYLVEVARLKPIDDISSLPEFKLRWDEKDEALDVDVYLQGKIRNGLWNSPGYSGHKTTRVPGKGRIFSVNIKIPDNRIIFSGKIKVVLHHEINLKEKLDLSDEMEIK